MSYTHLDQGRPTSLSDGIFARVFLGSNQPVGRSGSPLTRPKGSEFWPLRFSFRLGPSDS
jgi:hypothetical protein